MFASKFWQTNNQIGFISGRKIHEYIAFSLSLAFIRNAIREANKISFAQMFTTQMVLIEGFLVSLDV